MNFRTDLALERHETIKNDNISGIKVEEKTLEDVKITQITVTDAEGEKALGKKIGRYVTAEFPFIKADSEKIEKWSEILGEEIKKMLPDDNSTVLVAGLGNRDITPDALGPDCISLLLATRHIKNEVRENTNLSSLRSVAGIVPGVLGNTGIETAEILKAVTDKVNPGALIVIDALASRSLERLGTTVQMCDTGVSPGSGVGNRRKTIDKDFLGVPVIAIGVPTVVDGITVALDVIEASGLEISEDKRKMIIESEKGMMVTPKEIDLVIKRAAKLLALSVNRALQPELSVQDITAIVSSV